MGGMKDLLGDTPYIPSQPLTPPAAIAFDGPAYSPGRDYARLIGQTKAVFDVMKDGRWRRISHIAELAHAPENSVSAQLRHLRKPKFGGHTVNRRHVKNSHGLYEYQLVPNPGTGAG